MTDDIYDMARISCEAPITSGQELDLQRFAEAAQYAQELEYKLQEAELLIKGLETTQTFLENENKEFERQRDEADNKCNSLREQLVQEEGKQTAMQAERNQLIKVVDALMHTTSPHASLNDHVKAREAYSLLPHVQAKKGNKQ